MRVNLNLITVNPRKYAPPFFHTTLRQKWGVGVCSNINFTSMNVYYRKSAALALKLSQEASQQLASPVVAGGNPM